MTKPVMGESFPVPMGFVLVGGSSRRMGLDKASLELLGQTLLSRAVGCLQEVAARVAVIGGVVRSELELSHYPDLEPGRGPLEGIRTGLRNSPEPFAFFLPCDCPLVPPRLLTFLCRELGDALVAVPRDSQGQIHPLVGIYRRACLSSLEQRLAGGRFSAHGFLESLEEAVRILDVSRAGIPDSALFNVNTPEDLEKARRLMVQT